MAETAISWAHYTFNPWIGCQEVSPACDFCYAKRQNEHRKWVKGWGPHGERRRTKTTWSDPKKWQREAERLGIRYRVFGGSLMDWLDNKADPQWREEYAGLIEETPNLDWMLLSKRLENWKKLSPWASTQIPDNVWIGCTVENQVTAEQRISHLLQIPARIRFLSCEPLLGPVSLHGIAADLINWVIAGGESGPQARPSHPDWFRSLRDDCQKGGVPFHFKQWGEWHESDLRDKLPARRHLWPDGKLMVWDGVKKAGRVLDGRSWDGFPT